MDLTSFERQMLFIGTCAFLYAIYGYFFQGKTLQDRLSLKELGFVALLFAGLSVIAAVVFCDVGSLLEFLRFKSFEPNWCSEMHSVELAVSYGFGAAFLLLVSWRIAVTVLPRIRGR